MKFITNANAHGTHLQGYISVTYDQLIARFGQPEFGGDKTTVEWCLEFEDGTIATVYDWKEYRTPMGMYDWHIGGNDQMAVIAVHEAFKQGATV